MPVFPEETRTAVPTVNETQIARFPASMATRLIERCSITGPPDSACVLYVGQINELNRRDSSATGQADTAEYPQGLLVPAGHDVFLVWNRTDGQATATIQWKR